MSANKEVDAKLSLQVNFPCCGYCRKSIVKSSTKCHICHKFFHPGCGTKMKKCCDVELTNPVPSDKMSGSSSPICETTAKHLSIDSTQPDLLLRIISELESKNNILMENNSLLRFKIDSLEYQLKNKKHEINELNKKFVNIMPSIMPDKQHISDDVSVGNSEDSHATIPSAVTNAPSLNVDKSETRSSTAAPINIKYPPQKITYSQVTQAIRSARQLNGRDGVSEAVPAEKNSDSEWKFVKNKNRKPRKTLVVGTYSGAADVEGLDKFKAFHVSNLKPDTSVENLQNFLKNKFSNVICEKLSSRYPNSYSSFKVLIPSSEYNKALEGSNWPNKVNVHHFFHRKRTNQDQLH